MLKKISILVLFCNLCISTHSVTAGEDVKFILDIEPISFLRPNGAGGFSLHSEHNATEGIALGTVAWTPHLKLGAGFKATELIGIDVTGGVGYLSGVEQLSAPFYLIDIKSNFRISSATTLGPHISYIIIDELDWDGEAVVAFSDTSGVLMGIAFTAGPSKASFSISLDYANLNKTDYKTGGGWVGYDDPLDLSGWMINIGMKARF